MIMGYSIETIALTAIDESDRRFLITTREDWADLLESIKIIGLLSPPLLLPLKNGRYCIVSGRRRMAACKESTLLKIPARILPDDTPFQDCAMLAVAENSLERPLNILEQARSYTLLSAQIESEPARTRIYQALGLPHHPVQVAKIQRINSFPAMLQTCVLGDSIPLTIALLLADLPGPAGMLFARLFTDLKIGLNKQREILTIAGEIAAREDVDLMAIFSQEPLKSLLSASDLDRGLRTQKIREYLRKRRYPRIAAAEKKIMECLKDLPLQDDMRLTPPPHLEDTTYTFSLQFRNMDEFTKAHDRMQALVHHPSLTKLLQMVSQG